MDSLIEIPPEEDPENMPSATEELLQIMEDFADIIDKFMFEIVTFLAVVDSAMGLIKDVLGLFGFEGWKMAFFPTFSFIVTTGVFLFGAQKRKGKRDADVPEGLGEAFAAFENVMEVVEDVAEGLEDIDKEGGGDGGELGDVLGDVVGSSVGLSAGSVAGQIQGTVQGNEEDANISNTSADTNQNIARKVIAVAVLAAGIMAKLKKKRGGGQGAEDNPTRESVDGGEGSYGDDGKQKAGTGMETPQGSSQQNEWQFEKTPAITGASSSNVDNHKPPAPTTCSYNESVIIDLSLANRGEGFAGDTSLQNAAKSSVISAERQLRWNYRQLARGVEQGASEIKHGIGGASLSETSIHTEEGLRGTTHPDEDIQNSEKQLQANPLEMASGVIKSTTDLAGSAVQNVDQQARKGVDETRKKSGSILHIAIRLVRLVVRVVNKKKGESSAGSAKSEESTEKGASTDIKGSTVSLESDSVYFDCISTSPKQTQRFEGTFASCKSLASTGTQTDRENSQPRYRSEPRLLYQDSIGMFVNEQRSAWDDLRRSVLSMPDIALKEMRDAADGEMRLRGKSNEQLKVVAETMALRPAWLGSRDEVAGRLSKEVPRNNETLLHVASPYSRFDESGPRHNECTRIPSSPHLDAPVILHRSKDSKEPNQESGPQVSLQKRETTENPLRDSFLHAERTIAGVEYNAKHKLTSSRGVPSGRDRVKSPTGRNARTIGSTERDKVQHFTDHWSNGSERPGLDTGTIVKVGNFAQGFRHPSIGPEVRGGRSATDNWTNNDQDEESFDRGIRDRNNSSRERSIRSSSSYEGLEEYEDRSERDQYYGAKSANGRDLSSSQRTVDYKHRNLWRLPSYEQTEEDFPIEADPYKNGDWRSERSAGNNRHAPKTNRRKHSGNVSPSKSRHQSRLTPFEGDRYHDGAANFSQTCGTNSPVPQSGSSESVESLHSQRRSNMSLSSVRFADEEPSAGRVSRSSSRQEKNVKKYTSQPSMKQSGPRVSRRKMAGNERWNSAVCLTGHQKPKMTVSSRQPYVSDDYISDEIGSPRFRPGNRKRVDRGPSFNRLSRGPSTISRTRSANYLGDDESDHRA